ncbi:hypothetical protein C8J57DRAFT_1711312 [Mycena rebaudengoi]|nr:hypothetical protein C8J57DRAFT_1711312 [Mycena rebaudengoi]
MASVAHFLRAYYVPQFVLGGITRAVAPVVLRYTAKVMQMSKPVHIPRPYSDPKRLNSEPVHEPLSFPPILVLDVYSEQQYSFPNNDTKITADSTEYTVVTAMPRQWTSLACYPVSAIHARCSSDLPSFDPPAKVEVDDATLASTVPSPSATIPKFQPSPIIFILVFGVVMSAAIAYHKRKNSTSPLFPANRNETMKPSDSPNWRVPRRNPLTTQDPTVAETITAVFTPTHTRIPPSIGVSCQAVENTTQSTTVLAAPTATPTYVPPHKRPGFNGVIRRPLVELVNDGDRGSGIRHRSILSGNSITKPAAPTVSVRTLASSHAIEFLA